MKSYKREFDLSSLIHLHMHPCTSTWHSKQFLAPALKIRNHTDETKEEIAMCFKLYGFFSYSNLRARYWNSVIASLGKRLTATRIWYQGINLTYLISWNSCVSTARSFRPFLFFRVAVQALHDHHQRFEMHVDQCSLSVLINWKVQNEANGNCHVIKITALNEYEQSTYYFFCIIVSTKLYIGKEQTEKERHSEAEAPEAEFRCERSSRILILSVTWSKLTNRSEHMGCIVWLEDLGMDPRKNKQVSANKRLIWKLFELWEGFSKRNKTVYYSQG